MNPFFKNSRRQKEYDENGYVVLTLLSEEQTKALLQIFYEKQTGLEIPFTLCSPDYNLKKEVHERLNEIISPLLAEQIEGFECLGANFFYKKKGQNNNAVPIHQDWTFVDEKETFSLNVWIPLVDVDAENGAYHILPNSHTLAPFSFRGSNVPSACRNLNFQFDELYYLPLKAGQAIIYDHRLFHATPPNISNADRISITINYVPKEKQLIHAFMTDLSAKELSIYHVKPEFYWDFTFSYVKNVMPKGYQPAKTIPFIDQPFDPALFKPYLKPITQPLDSKNQQPKTKSWWQKLLGGN